MTWYYNDSIFTNDDIKDYVGFVYLITETSTNKQYIGQKVFWNKKAKKPLKGKVNRRLSKVPSDWTTYYGSNTTLKLLVEKNGGSLYKRDILYLCNSKAELNYLESKEIFLKDAVLRDEYFNDWVSARINRNQLEKWKSKILKITTTQ